VQPSFPQVPGHTLTNYIQMCIHCFQITSPLMHKQGQAGHRVRLWHRLPYCKGTSSVHMQKSPSPTDRLAVTAGLNRLEAWKSVLQDSHTLSVFGVATKCIGSSKEDLNKTFFVPICRPVPVAARNYRHSTAFNTSSNTY
jgi:hypothetical protein